MAPPSVGKPAPANAGNGLQKNDQVRPQINPEDSNEFAPDQPFIDKFGHLHSAAVLWAWSPEMQRAMRIRRVEPGEAEGGTA